MNNVFKVSRIVVSNLVPTFFWGLKQTTGADVSTKSCPIGIYKSATLTNIFNRIRLYFNITNDFPILTTNAISTSTSI